MLGFIKKDLLMIKSNTKTLIILLIIYVMMAYQGQIDLTFLLPFMSVMVMISTFSYDAYNKWDAYAITIPNGRKNSVLGKYLATLILILVTTIVITLVSLFISYTLSQKVDYEYTFSSIFGCLFSTILLQSIMYPAMYKFGPEKARIGIFILVFGTIIIGGLLTNFIDLSVIIKLFNIIDNYWIFIIPVLIILMLFISYKVSERIYIKKEF